MVLMKTLQLYQGVPGFHVLQTYAALCLLEGDFLFEYALNVCFTEPLTQGRLANSLMRKISTQELKIMGRCATKMRQSEPVPLG